MLGLDLLQNCQMYLVIYWVATRLCSPQVPLSAAPSLNTANVVQVSITAACRECREDPEAWSGHPRTLKCATHSEQSRSHLRHKCSPYRKLLTLKSNQPCGMRLVRGYFQMCLIRKDCILTTGTESDQSSSRRGLEGRAIIGVMGS